MRTSLLFAFGVALVAFLPSGALAQDAKSGCAPVELLYDDKEELSEKRSDTNKDCSVDEIVRYEGGKPRRAEKDTDFDGRMDTWVDYDDQTQPSKQESDTDGDGKPDRWVEFQGGQPAIQREDRNADGKHDATLIYRAGQPSREEVDDNFDGKLDRWVT